MWFVFPLVPAAVDRLRLVAEGRVLPWLGRGPDDAVAARGRKGAIRVALGLGALAAFPIELAVRGLAAWTRVDPKAPETGALSSIIVMLLVFAPFEEASKAAALWPLRARRLEDGEAGVVLGSAVATGFACVEAGLYLRGAAL